MRDRTCFLCKDPLSYEDYIATNLSVDEFIVYTKIVEFKRICKIIFTKKFKKHELVKLWRSDDIELACCHCRKFLDMLITKKPVTWKLLEWAHDMRLRTLKELGILNREQLKALKNKKIKKKSK